MRLIRRKGCSGALLCSILRRRMRMQKGLPFCPQRGEVWAVSSWRCRISLLFLLLVFRIREDAISW